MRSGSLKKRPAESGQHRKQTTGSRGIDWKRQLRFFRGRLMRQIPHHCHRRRDPVRTLDKASAEVGTPTVGQISQHRTRQGIHPRHTSVLHLIACKSSGLSLSQRANSRRTTHHHQVAAQCLHTLSFTFRWQGTVWVPHQREEITGARTERKPRLLPG